MKRLEDLEQCPDCLTYYDGVKFGVCPRCLPPEQIQQILNLLRRNLAVAVDVEEVDTDGGYHSNDKRYLTVSLTLHGEVISQDTKTIYLNT
jgi:hypothetical protein